MLGAEWRKATRSCAAGHCVEVRLADQRVEVRHSKTPDAGSLAFTREEWSAFLDGTAAGEFNLPA